MEGERERDGGMTKTDKMSEFGQVKQYDSHFDDFSIQREHDVREILERN